VLQFTGESPLSRRIRNIRLKDYFFSQVITSRSTDPRETCTDSACRPPQYLNQLQVADERSV
jgi:hypothetical protein